MTLIDLFIVGVVCAGLILFLRHREALSDVGLTMPVVSVILGLGVTAAFYVADLATMWVLGGNFKVNSI